MYGSQAVWSAAPHATSHAQRKPQNATISHFTEYLKSLNNGCHRQEKKNLKPGEKSRNFEVGLEIYRVLENK